MQFNVKKIITKSVLSVLFASLSLSVWPGVFTVTPVRIYMTPQDRAIAVTVTNDGDETLVMQADIYEWKQKLNGEDDLTLSEDLFLSPPILKVAPKSRQVVRLARVKKSQQGPREIT
jgi:fimbrial chaperone protein